MPREYVYAKDRISPGVYYKGVKILQNKNRQYLWACRTCLFPKNKAPRKAHSFCRHCKTRDRLIPVPTTRQNYSRDNAKLHALHHALYASAVWAIESGEISGYDSAAKLLRAADYGALKPYRDYGYMLCRFDDRIWTCDLTTQPVKYEKFDMLRLKDIQQMITQQRMTQLRLCRDIRATMRTVAACRDVSMVMLVREMVVVRRAQLVRRAGFGQLPHEAAAQITAGNMPSLIEV